MVYHQYTRSEYNVDIGEAEEQEEEKREEK